MQEANSRGFAVIEGVQSLMEELKDDVGTSVTMGPKDPASRCVFATCRGQ